MTSQALPCTCQHLSKPEANWVTANLRDILPLSSEQCPKIDRVPFRVDTASQGWGQLFRDSCGSIQGSVGVGCFWSYLQVCLVWLGDTACNTFLPCGPWPLLAMWPHPLPCWTLNCVELVFDFWDAWTEELRSWPESQLCPETGFDLTFCWTSIPS